MRIAVIGGGYVGLVSGACLAEKGHEVFIVEHDADKVAQINSGISPIHEPDLEDILSNTLGRSLQATAHLEAAVRLSDLTIIAVGTPFNGDQIDLSQIEQVSIAVGRALAEVNLYHVILVKSTVVPGTTDELVLPLLEQHSGKRAGVDFGVGMNPEFLREGCAVSDFMLPDRIVIGGIDDRTQSRVSELYAPFGNTDKVYVNNRSAEMIKYASNSLFATLISFSNEIGNLCADIDGVDVKTVLEGVRLDKRLSPILQNGERIDPGVNSYLTAGCGFGGSCFPKDVNALKAFGEQRDIPMPMLDAVLQTNSRQPTKVLDLLARHIPNVANKKITVLGLAFKPDTDDVRESASLPIINQLHQDGAQITAYDPAAMQNCQQALESIPVEYAQNMAHAISHADAILVLTAWSEFQTLPELLDHRKSVPIVVDGRRILDPTSIALYEGIGRGLNQEQQLHSDGENDNDDVASAA